MLTADLTVYVSTQNESIPQKIYYLKKLTHISIFKKTNQQNKDHKLIISVRISGHHIFYLIKRGDGLETSADDTGYIMLREMFAHGGTACYFGNGHRDCRYTDGCAFYPYGQRLFGVHFS